MARQFFRLVLLGVVAFVAIRACKDWQARQIDRAVDRSSPSDPEAATASTYATEKARRMEEEARAINQRFEEIRNATGMTESERQRALAELMERQRRLLAEGESKAEN